MENKIIVALDFNSSSQAVEFVDTLDPKIMQIKNRKRVIYSGWAELGRNYDQKRI